MSRSKWSVYSGAFLMVLSLWGCGGPNKEVKPDENTRPLWIDKGGKAFTGPDADALYGVGVVSGVQNEALARDAAGSRARTEIGTQLSALVKSMVRDYMASTTAADFKKSSEEQYIEHTSEVITKVNLSGVQIVDRWVSPDGSTYYALAKLSADAVQKNLAQMQQLDSAVRDYVKQNAERAFENLNQQTGTGANP